MHDKPDDAADAKDGSPGRTRPTPLPVQPDAVPAELKILPRWVCWRYTWKPNKNKPGEGDWTKPPFAARTGRKASSTDRDTWSTFDEAFEAYQRGTHGFDGIGFALSAGPDDPLDLAGVDLDKTGNPPEGWADDAARALASYAEWSPSGRGLRIFLRGHLPTDARKRKGRAEAYQVGRYLTVTGHRLPDAPPDIERPDDDTLRRVLRSLDLLPDPEQPRQLPALPNVNAPPDGDIVACMFAASNGPAVRSLWNGDTSAHNEDHSTADLALCNHLAFWTRRDASLMDRLFRASGLMRPKWDERHSADGRTYGRLTIEKAIACCRTTYDPNRNARTRGHGTRALDRGSDKEGDGLPGPIGPDEPPGEPQTQPPAPLDRWPLTDDGNGRRLVARHGPDLRYFAGWKKWAVWDGGTWRMDDTEEVSRRAKDVARAIYASATDAMRLLDQ